MFSIPLQNNSVRYPEVDPPAFLFSIILISQDDTRLLQVFTGAFIKNILGIDLQTLLKLPLLDFRVYFLQT